MASCFLKEKNAIPDLGVGLGLRRELAEEIFANGKKNIDWLEVSPENYLGIGGGAKRRIEAAASEFQVVSHGLNLSIGSTDPLNMDYLRLLKDFLDQINPPWWSDHLCFTSIENRYMHDLLPLPFTKEAVDHIVERIKRVQDFIERPFLLENISFYMYVPGSTMPETEFISEILEKADCGLLLDVNNVIVNSMNLKFDATEFIDKLPLERVLEIHLAGHKKIGDYIIDTHGAPVIDPVFEVLDKVLKKTEVKGILLERDQNFPDLSELLLELARIREIVERNKKEKSMSSLEEPSIALSA